MSDENNDLFEGLQIMSAQELNNAVSPTSDTNGGEPKVEDEEEGFTISTVTSEIGDPEGTKETKEVKTVPSVESVVEDTKDVPVNEVKYKALIKELYKAGVITVEDAEKLDDVPGTFDSIKELIEKTVDGKAKDKEENWKRSMTGAKKRFLEVEDAFDDTDNAILMAQRLEFFDSLNEDSIKADVQLQKNLYYEQLLSKNFSKEDAVEAVNEAEALNKLEEKAMKAFPELQKNSLEEVNNSRLEKENKTKEEIELQTKAFENLLANIDSRESFIDGLSLNKIAKDKLKDNIIKPVYKDPKTGKEFNSLSYKQHRNPVEFEMIINYYDSLGLFNIDKEGKFKPDISKIKAVAKTAAINELDKVIATEEQRGIGRNTSVETSRKTEDVLNLLEKAFSKK